MNAADTTYYQKHLGTTPTYQVLQHMDWGTSVWDTYQGFLHSGDNDAPGIARRYLELQHKLNSEPRIERLVASPAKRLDPEILLEAISLVLHPYQVPLTTEALQGELAYHGVAVGYTALQRFCNQLSDQDTGSGFNLRRFVNPYTSKRYVYCSSEFQVYPELGDKIVEFMRRRSQRFGVVVDFKVYRLNGKRYPIMQTETSRYFVDPEKIMIVERLEPFAKQTKIKAKPHTSCYSLG